jgi:diguanylate cyclase
MIATSLLRAAVGVSLLGAAYAAGRASLRAELRTDALTGIANRAGLEADWARRAGGREPWSLVLVDLDDFKQVNDLHGHVVGDQVLVEVARRLRAVAEPGRDLVGRVGGDEFAVTAADDQACLIAQHVGVVLRRPIAVGTLRLPVTASVGVVQAIPGDDVQAVRHSADLALYGAKRFGKNRVVEFNPTAELATIDVERPAAHRVPDLLELAGVRR